MRSRKSAQSHEMLWAADKLVHPKILLLFLLISMDYTRIYTLPTHVRLSRVLQLVITSLGTCHYTFTHQWTKQESFIHSSGDATLHPYMCKYMHTSSLLWVDEIYMWRRNSAQLASHSPQTQMYAHNTASTSIHCIHCNPNLVSGLVCQ